MRDRSWMAALTGIAFLVLVIVGGAIQGEPPDPTDDSVEEIIDFYSDGGKIWTGALLQTLAAGSLVFFAGYLRKVLHAAEGPGHMLSNVVLAGATILATGAALDATINVALVETADEIEPAAVQALSALWANDFLVFALGGFVFILSAGLSVIRHGALPKWLGWVAIVLGIASVTPAGFFAFIGVALWIAIVSVMLALRERRGPADPPAAAPAAPAAPVA
jgi:hypothetical protein